MNTKTLLPTAILALLLAGCGAGQKNQEDTGFFTSGNREADQRADQTVSKTEQLRGGGTGGGGAGGAEKASARVTPDGKTVQKAEQQKSLFDRLGGEHQVNLIVSDWIDRALADPRVNWERKGVKLGGFSFSRNKSMQWDANQYNVGQLKKHLVQFIALSTGGPTFYDGRDMKDSHANLHITNAEFDAAVGDLKASLDKLLVPTKEQKELLSIVESTRPQVVQDR